MTFNNKAKKMFIDLGYKAEYDDEFTRYYKYMGHDSYIFIDIDRENETFLKHQDGWAKPIDRQELMAINMQMHEISAYKANKENKANKLDKCVDII